LPIVGDAEQVPGKDRGALDVIWRENGLKLDIARAYPVTAGARTLLRDFSLSSDALTITDDITLDEPKAITWVFMLRQEAVLSPGRAVTGPAMLHFDCALAVCLEKVPVADLRMARSFPGNVWRLMLTAVSAAKHRQQFIFTEGVTA